MIWGHWEQTTCTSVSSTDRLYLEQERRECRRSSPLAKRPSLWPADPLHPKASDVTAHTPLPVTAERTRPLGSLKFRNLGHVWGPLTHALQQNKRELIESEAEKDNPLQEISPAQAVRVPYLLVRKCSRCKAHSYVAKWGSKDHTHKTVFPNNSITSIWKHSSCQYLGSGVTRFWQGQLLLTLISESYFCTISSLSSLKGV